MKTLHKHRSSLTIHLHDGGEYDFDLVVLFSYTPGSPERGPSYASGGQPAEPPEIAIDGVRVFDGHREHMVLARVVRPLVESDDALHEVLIETAEEARGDPDPLIAIDLTRTAIAVEAIARAIEALIATAPEPRTEALARDLPQPVTTSAIEAALGPYIVDHDERRAAAKSVTHALRPHVRLVKADAIPLDNYETARDRINATLASLPPQAPGEWLIEFGGKTYGNDLGRASADLIADLVACAERAGVDFGLARSSPAVLLRPDGWRLLPYTSAMGEAAGAYLRKRGGDEARLPGTFFWKELYQAMLAAALLPSDGSEGS